MFEVCAHHSLKQITGCAYAFLRREIKRNLMKFLVIKCEMSHTMSTGEMLRDANSNKRDVLSSCACGLPHHARCLPACIGPPHQQCCIAGVPCAVREFSHFLIVRWKKPPIDDPHPQPSKQRIHRHQPHSINFVRHPYYCDTTINKYTGVAKKQQIVQVMMTFYTGITKN